MDALRLSVRGFYERKLHYMLKLRTREKSQDISCYISKDLPYKPNISVYTVAYPDPWEVNSILQ